MIRTITILLIGILFHLNLNAQNNESKVLDSISISNSINDKLELVDQDSILSPGVPVIFKFDTVFLIRTDYDGVSKEKRAEHISNKIDEISKGYNELNDTIYIHMADDFAAILLNQELAFVVTEKDALKAKMPLKELAVREKESFVALLIKHKYHLSSKEWMKRIGFSFAALVGLVLILWVIRWSFKLLIKRLSKFDKKLLKRRNNLFKYFIPKNTKNIFVFVATGGRAVIIVFFLLMYLPFLFSFLPWTQGIVDVFYGYIATPVGYVVHGLVNFIPDLFFIIVIMAIARYFVRVLRDMAEDIEEESLVLKSFPKDWAQPTVKLFSIIIYAFAVVMVFPHLPGSDSPAFKGVSLFLGVLFSLGSTSAIANIVAGIVITYMRPFQIGDRVQIMDTVGDVVDKTLLVTKVRTLKNEDVTIPNALIINNHLINFTANSKEIGLILHTSITLGYDIEHATAEKLLLRAARQSILLQKDPMPFVLQKGLEDNYVTYELNAYTKQAGKMALIYSDINKNILEVFNNEGVEILSPKYVASRDGNYSTVPSQKGVDLRNPLEKAVDHLIGKNQKVKVEPVVEKEKAKTTTTKKPVEKKEVKETTKKEIAKPTKEKGEKTSNKTNK
ncbi:MAG: mechanosensitive ion channel family protein [Bacteroidales bacterium]|nr:mechanosensitive ion channel family protein [Bacteroidales bacterium]